MSPLCGCPKGVADAFPVPKAEVWLLVPPPNGFDAPCPELLPEDPPNGLGACPKLLPEDPEVPPNGLGVAVEGPPPPKGFDTLVCWPPPPNGREALVVDWPPPPNGLVPEEVLEPKAVEEDVGCDPAGGAGRLTFDADPSPVK